MTTQPDTNDYVLRNLGEAADHLESAISALCEGNTTRFETWMPWVYRKLNAAWNSRLLSSDEAFDSETHEVRCRFPREIEPEVTESPLTTDN